MTATKKVFELRPLKIFAIALIVWVVVKWLALLPSIRVIAYDDHYNSSLLILSSALLCFALDILSVYLILSKRKLFILQLINVFAIACFLYGFVL